MLGSVSQPPSFWSFPWLYLRYLVTPLTAKERKGLQDGKNFFATGSGYFAEQSTKPQTLGYSLADSPAGMLAWIYEKLVAWTDDYPWTDDEGNHHTQIIISFLLMKSDSPIMGLYLLVLQAWTCGLCSHLLRSCPDRRAVC